MIAEITRLCLDLLIFFFESSPYFISDFVADKIKIGPVYGKQDKSEC
jgi:hypothetical protein